MVTSWGPISHACSLAVKEKKTMHALALDWRFEVAMADFHQVDLRSSTRHTAFTDISVPKTWVEEAHTVCTENAPHAMQGIISFFCYGWNLLPESRRGPGGAWNCVVQSADAPDLGRQKITDHDIVSDCQIWSFLGLLNMGEVYSSMPYLAQVAKLQRVTSANGTPPYAHCAAAVASVGLFADKSTKRESRKGGKNTPPRHAMEGGRKPDGGGGTREPAAARM
jgi:hypothetical protein